ncbi:uncharacterized protein LOC106457697 [Limulus polyphemus]|uniref:Uncharacterized protein LOC106457697 n=1 Tax=Limulus polyphemus TaxID=6850 RepID=A0ABM1S706_LIMPO|nr:uncharacterized protein LOC106457697 [Limulus polyphemus]
MSSYTAHSWSHQRVYSPREFVRRFALPQIVTVHEGMTHHVQTPTALDIGQPFLLYQSYSCRKVHGRSLDRDKIGRVKTVGLPLVIPDIYSGWLAVISNDGHTAGYFTTIEQVARARVPLFVTKNGITGYQLPDPGDIERKSVYIKVSVPGGQALKLLGVYEDISSRSKGSLGGRNWNDSNRGKYAKCFTQMGEILFIPFFTSGKFYAVARRSSYSINHIFLLPNLLRVFQLPLTARLIGGSQLKLPSNFTGVVHLQEVKQQDVILACTFRNGEPVLVEIDLDSSFSLVKKIDDLHFQSSGIYQQMLKFCAEEADNWKKQIKVTHHVVQHLKQTENKQSSDGSSKRCKNNFEKELETQSISISMNFEDFVSERGSMKSKSALGSTRSSSSSRFSNPLSKLWSFRKSKTLQMVREGECEEVEKNWGKTWGNASIMSCSAVDTHLYETLNRNNQPSCRLKREPTSDLGMFRRPTDCDNLNGDDGYGTYQANEDSSYYSVCY